MEYTPQIALMYESYQLCTVFLRRHVHLILVSRQEFGVVLGPLASGESTGEKVLVLTMEASKSARGGHDRHSLQYSV